MITRVAVRIAVAGVVAAAALGVGPATTAHHPRTATALAVDGLVPPPLPGEPTSRPTDTWPACPNCFG
jgi:hypothetical protein